MREAARDLNADRVPHIPVLIGHLLDCAGPITGNWLDGTFGAGGYARALLDAGARSVIGVDRDPLALQMAQSWLSDYAPRLRLVAGNFSQLDTYSDQRLDGIVLDLGVSSMQIDLAERGFSFMRDGPLDMRMSQSGKSAADLVNHANEGQLADILFYYGEERASRRIAQAIVAARANAPITATLQLAEIVASCLPRPKPNQSHPATRSFQALRIAVNTELSDLANGLSAAERALAPGGVLAVVTFHSLEDRIVKRYFQAASGRDAQSNRYAPAKAEEVARYTLINRSAITADAREIERNPRSRSAKLRIGRRTSAAPEVIDYVHLGVPQLPKKGYC
ncbi:MAG: 16S rRNA (cytosine1402-N4)-methyltransferase [Paracoccaceae bacterium]|jgi:16S rRNA (cytosine1402-N4)-methyltransferase